MWVCHRYPMSTATDPVHFIYGLQSAVLGSTNVLRQAIDIGIKRFSVTSSVAAAIDCTKAAGRESVTEDGVANFTFRVGPRSPLTPGPDRLEPRDAGTSSCEREAVLRLLRL